MTHGVTKKKETQKKLKHTSDLFRKNLRLKGVTYIIDQRKAGIPKPSCARKEIVDIDILVTSLKQTSVF